jgi:hypothetical protein
LAKKTTPGQARYQQAKIRRALKEVLSDAKFLNEVLTLPEVMALYNKSRASVLGAINTSRLVARKAEATERSKGGSWLILKSSIPVEWKEVKQ